MEEKSGAPALARGLTVLEIIAKEKAIGFTELKEQMGLHATTLNRLLKVLVEKEYLRKDYNNRYTLGLSLFNLSNQETFWKRTIEKLQGPMKRINETYGMSVLLVAMEQDQATVIYKILESSNLGMLEVGTVRKDLSYFPWGILYMANLHADKQEEIMRYSHEHNVGNMRTISREEMAMLIHEALNKGHVDDRALFFSGRRFAVPICMPNGKLIGALCTGSNGEHLENLPIEAMLLDMKKAVGELEF